MCGACFSLRFTETANLEMLRLKPKEQKLDNFPFFSPLRHEETRSYMVKEDI